MKDSSKFKVYVNKPLREEFKSRYESMIAKIDSIKKLDSYGAYRDDGEQYIENKSQVVWTNYVFGCEIAKSNLDKYEVSSSRYEVKPHLLDLSNKEWCYVTEKLFDYFIDAAPSLIVDSISDSTKKPTAIKLLGSNTGYLKEAPLSRKQFDPVDGRIIPEVLSREEIVELSKNLVYSQIAKDKIFPELFKGGSIRQHGAGVIDGEAVEDLFFEQKKEPFWKFACAKSLGMSGGVYLEMMGLVIAHMGDLIKERQECNSKLFGNLDIDNTITEIKGEIERDFITLHDKKYGHLKAGSYGLGLREMINSMEHMVKKNIKNSKKMERLKNRKLDVDL